MIHEQVIESALVNLESRVKSQLLIRLPVVTHKILRAYARSLGRPLNAVVATVLEELAASVQDKFVIRYASLEAVKKPAPINDVQFEERAHRFQAYKEAALVDPMTDPAAFGLIQLPQTKGNNINHYKLDLLFEEPLPMGEEPIVPVNGAGSTTVDTDAI